MIWRVVKWILFGLLALLALPLVLLVIIFLAIPVRYKVDAVTGQGDANKIFVRVTYFFGLVRATYRDKAFKMRIFGIPIGRKNRQLPDAEKKTEQKVEGKMLDLLKSVKEEKPAEKENPKRPIKERLANIKDSITKVLTYPNRKKILSLTLKMLGRLWKIIKPKKLNISGEVGFEDPSKTGFLFAAYGVVAEFLNIRKYVQLSGNFDTTHTVAQFDIYIKGSINVARMMLPILNWVRKKPIRKLIKDIIK